MENAEEAKSFVEKLANDLLRKGNLKSFDKAAIWEYFDSNVLELDDGNHGLMSFLTENRHAFGKKLIKLAKSLARNSCSMQTALSSGQKSEAQPLPYNLYASNKIKKRTVVEHHSNPCSIYSAYLSERMAHLEDSKGVLKLMKRCLNSSATSVQCSWLQEIRKLCAITCTQVEPKVLHFVMEIFNMRLSSMLECRSWNEECLSDVKSAVEDFVTFCLRKFEQVGEYSKKPRFCDLLAAMMSMYTDVVLLSSRNKSESDQVKEGKKLCGLICFIFRDHPEFILDVVIQLSECQISDGSILVPLYKKTLAKPVGNVNSIFYTKYIIASCQCRRLFPELMSDVIAQVLDVAAPADYVKWLKEKDSSIADVIPKKKSFSAFRITKFLLNKATEDLLNKLLDVLTDANVVSEEKLDSAQMTSENHTNEMFFIDRASSSKNARFLQEEDMEIAEVENNEELVDGKAVDETEIVIRFDRGSVMSSETPEMPFEEHRKTRRAAEQEKVFGKRLEKEEDENDEINSQSQENGLMEKVNCEIIWETIDENSTSSEVEVEKEIENIIEVASDIYELDDVAVEISDESEDEESHEVLINLVLDCIEKGDTSECDIFEDGDEISQKKVDVDNTQVMSAVEGTDLKKVSEASEQTHRTVEPDCSIKDLESEDVELEMGEIAFQRSATQEYLESHDNNVELTPSKHTDESEFCIDLSKASDKIRSPHSDSTSPAKSKRKRQSADHVIKCTKEETASNVYTMLKLGDRTPEKPKKVQGNNCLKADDGTYIKSPKSQCGNRDKNVVEEFSSDLVMIEDNAAKIISTQNQVLKSGDKTPETSKKVLEQKWRDSDDGISIKSPSDSFLEPRQLRQSKSAAYSLHLPSAWSSKHDCSTPQSPTVSLERTIIADSSERCSAKSPKNLTNSSPQLPDFKKFLKSPGDVYDCNSDIDKSPLLFYTRPAKLRGSEHEALSPTQPKEKSEKGCKVFEGIAHSTSSESPEVLPIAFAYSPSGKRGTIGRGSLLEFEVVNQNDISDVVESSPSTPVKSRRRTHDTESRAGSEDPDGNLNRRRSVRIQNKLSVAAKVCSQDVPPSPVVNSRKRKASVSMEPPKKLKL